MSDSTIAEIKTYLTGARECYSAYTGMAHKLVTYCEDLESQLAESELRFEDADKQARKHFDLYNKAEAQVADMESEMDKAETAYNTAVSHNVILEAQLDAVTKLIEKYMKYNKHGRGCDCELHRIKALIGEIT